MNTTSVRRALYGKLAGDSTLNALLASPPSPYAKSVYYQQAPEGADLPYVIFQKQAGTPTHGWKGGANLIKDDVWTVKGIAEDTSADTAEAIQTRLDALLTDASLSISGESLLWLRPQSDIDYSEVTSGSTFKHSGAMYRLVHAP